MNAFDDNTNKYEQWYKDNKFAYLSEIAALRKAVPKQGIGLEIGVGTGRFAEPLGVSYGIDPSVKMLKVAKNRGIKTFLGKGENLPFEDKEFDCVLMVTTLSFVDKAEQVITEAKRVLKNKGRIIIGEIDRESHLGKAYQKKIEEGHRIYKNMNMFSAEEIIDLLKKHKFINISTYQILFQPVEKIQKLEQARKGFGIGGFVW
ncbi:MAG: SAM-dependent methyltransferase [Elusimicrobia bacterium RIFOXYA2_FULL_40_6]|nr:MAG: SAM-dependent methyltransferase [Elusimicrobia bacterium RIFOXYA2_FULL_40_6]